MAYLPSLPGDAVLLDVFRAYPGHRPAIPGLWSLYPRPIPLARKINNHAAFWGGVRVDLTAQAQDQASGAG